MGGGLMQLVAYGAQDIYLTGNPQITFFKVVYRRHTNFAVESIEQTFNGSAALGRKFTCTIARNGDLLHRVYLQADVTASTTTNDYLGFQLIDYVEVEIGGQVIDKQYGEWMAVWCDLTHTMDQSTMLHRMISESGSTLYIPLQFWFCRNAGLALPLIALQYHEVKLNVQMKSAHSGISAINNCSVWCDYIFLDTDERRRFAQVSHEYLIEQVQFSNELSTSGSGTQQELRFNHPVKELVWLVKDSDISGFTGYQQCDSALLQLNGQDRFKRRDGDYFTKVQRYEHHSGAGNPDTSFESVHVYSFGLKPEEHQPSGTCNFSRIDNAVLNITGSFTGSPLLLKVYAVNYNVLRIMSGMGGLAYSN
jgi:hypothetical protein